MIAKPENHHHSQSTYYSPALAGNLRIPLGGIPPVPLDARKIIGRRAAMELAAGDIINLGVGIPAFVASTVAEEGASQSVTFTTELGVFGGVPALDLDFGGAYNAEAMIEHASMFDFYDGGGLDVTFVGLAQVDRKVDVNVSRFGNRVAGPGGFINITQNSKKVVFCGMFAIGSEAVIEDGRLRITREGKGKKFIERVEQVTFSGAYATRTGLPVLFVTERGVLQLSDGELEVIEIAPGVDLERDILAMMEFRPKISPTLKSMEPALFQPHWGGLQAILEARKH